MRQTPLAGASPDRPENAGPYEWESYDDWQHRRQIEVDLRDDPPIYSPESDDGQRFGDWRGRLYMAGLAVAVTAVILLTISYCSKAHAEAPPIPQCTSHTEMLANLANGYGERRVTDGFVVMENHLSEIMELTVNRETGTWTMLLINPQSGWTCIPFSGTNFGKAHPAAKPEKGT